MKKNEELYNDLINAKYGDLFFCGFKDNHNDVKRLLENKLINNMYLLEFIRKEKCEAYKYDWYYYFLEFDILKNEIKEVRMLITLKDDFVSDSCIIAKYPLSKSQLLHLIQKQEEEDEHYKKLFDEIAERKRLDEIREDNKWREQMG